MSALESDWLALDQGEQRRLLCQSVVPLQLSAPEACFFTYLNALWSLREQNQQDIAYLRQTDRIDELSFLGDARPKADEHYWTSILCEE